MSSEFADALKTVFQRYTTYLDAFGPDETYLRKKVETELGSKMIYLKMRCSGLGSEWGKVLEQVAPYSKFSYDCMIYFEDV